MRKILSIVTVFMVMISLCVFPSFASDDAASSEDLSTDQSTESETPAVEDPISELTAHGPRSERMKDLLAGYESGLIAGETRYTMSDSIERVFTDVFPGWANVAVWLADRVNADVFVYLCVMVIIFSVIGGYKYVDGE